MINLCEAPNQKLTLTNDLLRIVYQQIFMNNVHYSIGWVAFLVAFWRKYGADPYSAALRIIYT